MTTQNETVLWLSPNPNPTLVCPCLLQRMHLPYRFRLATSGLRYQSVENKIKFLFYLMHLIVTLLTSSRSLLYDDFSLRYDWKRYSGPKCPNVVNWAITPEKLRIFKNKLSYLKRLIDTLLKSPQPLWDDDYSKRYRIFSIIFDSGHTVCRW